jgi:hypothetical protein
VIVKHSEALRHLEVLQRCVQKVRSNTAEALDLSLEELDKDPLSAILNKWVAGSTSLLHPLTKLLDAVDAGTRKVQPIDLYNMLVVAQRFQPAIHMVGLISEHDFPYVLDSVPDWITGFEPEEVSE